MLSDRNVEEIARLADFFRVGWLLTECEDFLIKTSDYPTVMKLFIADKFRMDRLKVRCEQAQNQRLDLTRPRILDLAWTPLGPN